MTTPTPAITSAAATPATGGTDGLSRYALSNDSEQGFTRLQQLAEILDEHSTDVLTELCLAWGAVCLDAGAGGGTITRWLADQVGPHGRVTALDMDITHLRVPGDNVDVQRGDIRTIALPQAHFDLAHARLLLLHFASAERDDVFTKLVTALKPGAALMLSEWEANPRDPMLVYTPVDGGAEAFYAYQTAFRAVLADQGADVGWARRVPEAMRKAGLVRIESSFENRLWYGGSAGCLLHETNAGQKRTQLLERGVSAEQLDLLRLAMHHPETMAFCYPMVTTVGRRPEN